MSISLNALIKFLKKKIMIRKFVFFSISSIIVTSSLIAQNTIDLAGQWKVQLDTTNEIIVKNRSRCSVSGEIILPASLAESKYGFRMEGSDFGILTPEYKYIGKAWYNREIIIPESWVKKNAELFLERVLWESVVWIDGKKLSRKDALGTPHIHRLGILSP